MGNQSEAKAKVTLDPTDFEKGAKAVVSAAEAMSTAVATAFAATGVAILAVFGAESVKGIYNSLAGVITLGEEMANAGKKAGLAAGQFYLFHNAIEKGLSLKTVAALIGENGDALNRSANTFRDVSIKLWAVGEKIRGFWLGLMERVAPVLSRLLDGTLGVQLVSAGNAFGDSIAKSFEVIYQLAKSGQLGTAFKSGVQLAFDYAGERLIWLTKLGYDVLELMFSTSFTNGILEASKTVWDSLKSLGANFGEQLGISFFKAWANITDAIDAFYNELDGRLNKLGLLSNLDLADNIARRGQASANAHNIANSGENNPEFKATSGDDFISKLKAIFENNSFKPSEQLADELQDMSKTVANALTAFETDKDKNPTTTFENTNRQKTFGADSLAAIGGGGNVYVGLGILDYTRLSYQELRDMNRKLDMGGRGLQTHVFPNARNGQPTISRAVTQPVVNQ